jgi:hypothetical protein
MPPPFGSSVDSLPTAKHVPGAGHETASSDPLVALGAAAETRAPGARGMRAFVARPAPGAIDINRAATALRTAAAIFNRRCPDPGLVPES